MNREHLLTGDLNDGPDRADRPDGAERVEVHRITLAPGQAGGRHLHPCAVAGYVTGGRVVFELEGGPAEELTAGSAFFEPAGAVVRRFDNASQERPATFVACYLLTGDEPLIQPL